MKRRQAIRWYGVQWNAVRWRVRYSSKRRSMKQCFIERRCRDLASHNSSCKKKIKIKKINIKLSHKTALAHFSLKGSAAIMSRSRRSSIPDTSTHQRHGVRYLSSGVYVRWYNLNRPNALWGSAFCPCTWFRALYPSPAPWPRVEKGIVKHL